MHPCFACAWLSVIHWSLLFVIHRTKKHPPPKIIKNKTIIELHCMSMKCTALQTSVLIMWYSACFRTGELQAESWEFVVAVLPLGLSWVPHDVAQKLCQTKNYDNHRASHMPWLLECWRSRQASYSVTKVSFANTNTKHNFLEKLVLSILPLFKKKIKSMPILLIFLSALLIPDLKI